MGAASSKPNVKPPKGMYYPGAVEKVEKAHPVNAPKSKKLSLKTRILPKSAAYKRYGPYKKMYGSIKPSRIPSNGNSVQDVSNPNDQRIRFNSTPRTTRRTKRR
jgi:hypothetical protein